MSCTYRQRAYRHSTTGREDDSTGWQGQPHRRSLPDRIDLPVAPGSGRSISQPTTVAAINGDVLSALLHDSDPTIRRVAVETLIHLITIHGWQQLSPLLDIDLRVVWPTVVSSIIRSASPLDAGYDDSAIGGLMRLLFTHASDDDRRWMWDFFCAAYTETPLGDHSLWEIALSWSVPVWEWVDEQVLIHDRLRHASGFVIGDILRAVESWIDDHDTGRRRRLCMWLYHLITEKCDPHTNASGRYDHWMTAVHMLSRLDPDLMVAVPYLIDGLVACCMHESGHVAHTSIAILRRYSHTLIALVGCPRWIAAMETIIRTSHNASVTYQVGTILGETACRYLHKRALAAHVRSAWKTLTNHRMHYAQRSGGVGVISAVMQDETAATVIRPYLEQIPTLVHTMPNDMFDSIIQSPWSPALVDTMITVASDVLSTRLHGAAMNGLIRAVQGGYGDRIMRLVRHRAEQQVSIQNGLLDALASGIYDPYLGSSVVQLIMATDPSHGAKRLAWGISDRFGVAIPPDVLPAIIQACLTEPGIVNRSVVGALWMSQPSLTADLCRVLLKHPDVNRVDVVQALGDGWGKGVDTRVIELIKHLIADRSAIDDESIGRALIDVILHGTGRADPTVLYPVWHHLIHRIPGQWLIEPCRQMAYRWGTGNPRLLGTMLRDAYQRLRSVYPDDRDHDLLRIVLHSLRAGWGYGVDAEILDGIREILNDSMDRNLQPTPATIGMVSVLVHTLGCGWRRGIDDAVAITFGSLLDWLDRIIPEWHNTGLARDVFVALNGGGRNLSTDDRRDAFSRSIPPHALRHALRRARTVVSRRIGNTAVEGDRSTSLP